MKIDPKNALDLPCLMQAGTGRIAVLCGKNQNYMHPSPFSQPITPPKHITIIVLFKVDRARARDAKMCPFVSF